MCTNTIACHNMLLLQYQQTCTVAVKAISHSPVKQKNTHLLSLYRNNKFLFHLNTYPFRYSARFFLAHSHLYNLFCYDAPPPFIYLSILMHLKNLSSLYSSPDICLHFLPATHTLNSIFQMLHPHICGWLRLAQYHEILVAPHYYLHGRPPKKPRVAT